MLKLRPLLILVLVSISAIHCKDEANLTQVSGNATIPVGMSINGETESPVDATTLVDDLTTASPDITTTNTTVSPKPTTTSTTPITTVTTVSTPAPTVPTTTLPPPVTTLPPSPTTTTKPVTTVKPIVPTTETPEPHKDRHFDGASFIGGIILAVGLMGIGFIAFKFYKARTERNYHTL